ncbi:MAG TPA: Hpt domain-containing protein [Pseudomonadales bacterium]|jgi:chemosensory pili system protein ChpA (sensor histidine kinase/response regulator)|nr:Hpt domain-containing protein [Pseudomonadales bacterium]
MSERQDYVALEWIKQEIAETLENAQQELQAVADSPDNASSMRSCLTAIHQVHGTLKVLGLEVALQFAEEMEATAQSLMNDSVPDAPRTQEILMQAILQMPMYLEQVQNDQQESLEQILPIINGLREVRGDERIGEPAQEAAPDFGIVNKKITKKTAEQFAASDGQVTVGKLRLRYQRSLKAILSKQDVRKNLGLLTKVFAMLAKICGKSPSGHLAQLGVAVVEAVTNGSVKLNAELSLSLRKIDKELKQLADEGIKKLARPVPEELILGMLRPLLNDAKETARILSIKETYVTADQQQREPEPQAVFGPDAETVSAVVKILIEEIVAAKDKLDLYVRSQVKSKDDLQSLIPVLEQVSNTLSVVELVEHQETIQAQIDVLSDAVSKDEEPTENVLMSVAGAFVQVETLLSPLVITSDDVIEPESMGNLDAAHSVVLNETRIGLAQCKDSVDDFKTSEWDHGKVEGLPKLLTDLSGGLSILTQTRAGDVLLACSGYIRTALLKESRVPELAEMEDLADVLTSVDYYLERFLENSKYPYTQMLDIAETSLEKLGFPISRIAELTEEDQQAAEEQIVTEDESQADEEFESSDSVDEDVADEQEDTAEEGDVTTEKVAVEAEVTDEQVEAAEEVAEVDAEEAEVPAEEVETAEEVAVDAEEVDVAAEEVEAVAEAAVDAEEADVAAKEVEAVAEAAVDAEEAEVTVEAVDTSEEVTDVDAPEAEIAEEEVQAAEEVVEIVAEEAEVTAEEVEATEETVEADAAGAEVAEEDTVIPAEEVEVPVDEAADAPDDATETVEIIDDEIIEIFIEEADEVMQAINEQLPIWKSNPTDSQAQTELRRAFHTLKGSSRMVGASVVAELAWSIEDMLNRVIDGSISTGPAMMTMMDEVVERIPEGVKAFENQSPNVIDVSDLIASAELYSEGQGDTVKEKAIVEESWEEPVAEEAELDELQIVEEPIEEPTGEEPEFEDLQIVEEPIEESIEEPTEKEPELEELQIVEEPIEKPVEEEPELEDLTFVEEPGDAEVEEEPAEDSAFTERDLEEEVGEESVDVEVSLGDEPTEQEPSTTEIDLQAEEGAEPPDAETDHELVEIFREEAADHLAVLKAFLEQAQAGPLAVSEQLLAALHTLKGSAAMAEVDSVAQIANPLDNLANQLYRRNIKIENDLLDLLQQGTALVGTALGDIEEYPSKLVEGTDHFLQNLANLRSEIITDIDRDNRTVDSEVTPFRFDEIDLLLDATELLARWEDHELTSLQAELKLLDKTAEQSGRQELHSLVQGLLQAHSHLDLSSPPTEAVLKALQSGHEAILDLLDQIAAGQELSLDESVLEHLTSLIQEPIEEPLVEETALEELPIVEEPIEEPIEKPIEEEAEQIIEEPVEESIEKEIDATKQFVLDARDHLNNMAVAIQKWNEDVNNLKDLEQLNHHVNQIRSVAEISGVTAFIAMCAPVMQLCERISTSKLVGTESDVKLFEECRSRFADLLNDIKDGSEIEPAHDLIAKVEARIRNELDQQADEQESKKPEEPKAPEEPDEPQDEVDADVLPIFLEEADELLESIDQSIHDWDSDRSAPEHLENLLRQLHTVKGGSRMAGLNSLGEYSHRFETFLIDIQKTSATVDDEFFADVNRRQDEVVRRVDIYRRLAAGEIAAEDVSTLVGSVQAPVAETADVKPAEATGPEVAEESAPADTSQPTEPEDEVDEDVLPIFLEEADELLESIDQSIHEWNSNRNAPVHLENLLRHLHTVKGGLRMAGLNSLGEYSHNFESLLIEFQKTSAPVDDEFFADLNRRQDEVVRRVEIYKRLAAGEIALGELAARVRNGQAPVAATARTEPTRPSGTDAARQPAPTAVAEQAPVTKAEPTQESAPEAAAPEASTPAAPQEMIRVSADLLEDLISLATESSITRGRIEQQISNFVESLDEMDMTVRRVRDQIRRLEMETESRESVLRERQEEDDGDVDEDAPFDELEMDRYTLLQEISRSLLEGVSDMLDLKDTLLDTSRDAETLLLQQTRVGNDLQEGLTRTRMVPFSRLLPRLRRVTRQISAEVGKKVRFDAYNIEGELDRNVLERIVAPLEHMLRNAVDHGIESVEKRKAASKPEVGRISLRLSREGAYVVLQISDDGGGIDANQIKSKAIERGLMSETSDLSDQEILQFIMKAGFSTAESLTQISGRGVGMDVVDTELKQLGATLTIDSSLGVGTEFSIRIPFTVSINRALMVVVKEETYAVPLNTIEGIVRVSPYELEAYYEPDAPMFEYAGQPYRLEYMGKILARSDTPNLAGKTSPLPVILARSGDHAVALQVDSVIGSREVVVKSLGQQLSKIGGVSGATILGDGSVVIILDVMALVRASDAHDLLDHIPEEQEVDEGQHVRTVMVVDDSVTVRKVTSRIIERQGWNVMVAKDGVDAVSQLQDSYPDVVLLDIEMPKMDGFEVLRTVRRDERLKHLPIIIITSRTGEKHKQQAKELGVNEYLGKPFQEEVLLSTIEDVLADSNS